MSVSILPFGHCSSHFWPFYFKEKSCPYGQRRKYTCPQIHLMCACSVYFGIGLPLCRRGKNSHLQWKSKLVACMHQTWIKAHAGGYSRSKYACPDSRRWPNSFKQKYNLTYGVINAMIIGREDTTVQAAAGLLSINRKLYYSLPPHTYLSQF